MLNLNSKFIACVLCLICFLPLLHAQKPAKAEAPKEIKPKYVISVVMPFCSKQIQADPNSKNAALGSASRQYYEGFKMALDSFNKSEVPIEVRVFDSQSDTNVFRQIVAKKEFQESNLVFGPVSVQNNVRLKEFCEKYKVYDISPFLTLSKTVTDNPYKISAYPDLKYYGDFILNQIKSAGWNDANVVVLTGKESNEKIIGARMLAIKNNYSGFSIKTLDISKYAEYRTLYKLDRPNHIIIDSDNEFLVSTVIKHLSDTNQFTDLYVYGSKNWFDFKIFNLPAWQQLNLNVVTPVFIDYDDPKVKNFIERYRERYFTEPSEFAINGFEQCTFFIGYFVANKGNMEKITEMNKIKPLSNWFKIDKKVEAMGYQNNRLNILYFEDNKLKRWD